MFIYDYCLTLYSVFRFQIVGIIVEELHVFVEKQKIRYFFNGVTSGIPIILLHGARFNADTWIETNTLEILTREGYSVYAVDLPGFGKSNKIPGTNSAADYSEFLFALLSILKLRKVVLLGPSLSGVISLIFTTKYPDQVSGLILVGSAGPEVEELKPKIRLFDLPTLIVWGEKDIVAPIHVAKDIHNSIKGSELLVIEGGNHPCYLDDPQFFNRKLIEFLHTNLKT